MRVWCWVRHTMLLLCTNSRRHTAGVGHVRSVLSVHHMSAGAGGVVRDDGAGGAGSGTVAVEVSTRAHAA